ncbi:hypothetical protein MUK42_37016 [Musa troglodytarum]|uniref:Uncharacterized protein n=1 Tax=Musa troglodytarum TaxID=320322 RepID=A0A9E7FJG9_9LILI|nr:hypothetical protein MUK42_37016 [Musa troglodytarum]
MGCKGLFRSIKTPKEGFNKPPFPDSLMGFVSRPRNYGEGEFAGSKHTDSFLLRFLDGDRGIGCSDHCLTALAFLMEIKNDPILTSIPTDF